MSLLMLEEAVLGGDVDAQFEMEDFFSESSFDLGVIIQGLEEMTAGLMTLADEEVSAIHLSESTTEEEKTTATASGSQIKTKLKAEIAELALLKKDVAGLREAGSSAKAANAISKVTYSVANFLKRIAGFTVALSAGAGAIAGGIGGKGVTGVVGGAAKGAAVTTANMAKDVALNTVRSPLKTALVMGGFWLAYAVVGRINKSFQHSVDAESARAMDGSLTKLRESIADIQAKGEPKAAKKAAKLLAKLDKVKDNIEQAGKRHTDNRAGGTAE